MSEAIVFENLALSEVGVTTCGRVEEVDRALQVPTVDELMVSVSIAIDARHPL